MRRLPIFNCSPQSFGGGRWLEFSRWIGRVPSVKMKCLLRIHEQSFAEAILILWYCGISDVPRARTGSNETRSRHIHEAT